MFGMGATEIVVILVVALIFLGPEKLPEAAKSISKGIRDLRKQTRDLQHTIEADEQIGGAIRDLKSALRGDEPRPRPAARPGAQPPPLPPPIPTVGQKPETAEPAEADKPAATAETTTTTTTESETTADDDVEIKPAPNAIAKGTETGHG